MRLVVFSYKPCWTNAESSTGYATDGGFPFQMAALSQLFDRTTLVLPRRRAPPPGGIRPLEGRRLEVRPVPEPAGRGAGRKLALLAWLPLVMGMLWRETGRADAVHAVVPGDVGALGLPLAFLRRKPLFVRHCGTWRRPVTVADRILHRVLVGAAGGRNVVLATGGGRRPPEPASPAVGWIFSTTLSEEEMAGLPRAEPWRPGEPPRLAAVGRLTRGKNAASTIRALADLRRDYPAATLDVLGDGPERRALEALAAELGVAGAVTFHGNLPHEEVLAALGRSHLLVFPTRVAEGFPKAVLEAMACGLPVLAPPVSVIPELLGAGRGFLLEAAEPEAVAAALRRLLASPGALAAAGEAARLHARRFTLERWRDAIGERLEEAWGRPLREAPQ